MKKSNYAKAVWQAVKDHPYIASFLLCAALSFTGYSFISHIEWLFLILTLLAAAAAILIYFLLKNKNIPALREKAALLLVFAEGFIFRFVYVLETPVTLRQNDVHNFGGNNGHAAYIEYIYKNFSLPKGDPTATWQFYHPPVHHIISAAWMRLLTFLGMPYESACESIQALTLFYSCCCLILTYKILRYFGLKGKPIVCALSIAAFHPSMVIMSGSINNDILSITFAIAALYKALLWYRKPDMNNTLETALMIGLGMSTKLSAALVAPAVAVIFLCGMYKYRSDIINILGRLVVFALACFPLGLWWSVKCFVQYRMPFGYVPDLGGSSFQYVGNIPTAKRLFDFSLFQFDSVFEQWGGSASGSYYEYNPTIAFLKNSLFGEHMSDKPFGGIKYTAPQVLFYAALFLAVISFVSLIAVQFIKGKNRLPSLALLIAHATYMISYYRFCFSYPYTCTMNFRYILPTMVIGAVSLGLALQQLKSISKQGFLVRYCRSFGYISAAVFCISSWLTYYFLFAAQM